MRASAHGLIATTIATAPRAELRRAASVPEALDLLALPGAVAVAGGTDLCAQYNEGAQPARLVALDAVEELRGITVAADEIRIGALTTHAAGSTSAPLRAALPGFPEAWAMLANPRVRFRATIGGNLMARRTRYEMSLLLTALGAELRFAAPGGGVVAASAHDLWEGRIPQPALLHHIAIPRRRGARFTYQRALRPQLTLALHLHDAGGLAAIGTEWLRPVALPPDDDTLSALPGSFADPVISHWYARRAGATLLRRAREALDAR
ncbi:MAG: FAD binding domain-containing protein [Acetobacteraceae bacterium]|nr:FAD binding domain-containing protein [Acetobacteraceae bacterium]